ncbi:M4 family metallopeptidase [Frankia sp. CiP1_Cm_nod1]|uniref:M4 family metallopeptidase n=1 Tax=Frankia sp. CiP1_Cm_nod1 TaxID=2897160 RepID=UPI002025082F
MVMYRPGTMPHRPLHCIVPPDLLARIVREGETEEERAAALRTLQLDHSFRLARAETAARSGGREARPTTFGRQGGRPQRTIYDQHHQEIQTPGTPVRSEGQPATGDPAVDEAYDGFGATYDFYWRIFDRDSIDGQGQPLLGGVHYGENYANAIWDAGRMFFGDGDGQQLTRTTAGLDVIAHELTHGVTQHEANLVYSGQSGALNESISDVMGSLVKQYRLSQKASDADWLIGTDIVGPAFGPALRSLKAPGTANRHDDQPADMNHYVHTASGDGGVHTNSGIPNRAFYIVADTLGGFAWEAPGAIWYATLRDPELAHPSPEFRTFARITLRQAQQIYGPTSDEAQAVRDGWDAVKVPLN